MTRIRMIRISTLLLPLVFLPSGTLARKGASADRLADPKSWCGTHDPSQRVITTARHLQNERRLARESQNLVKAGLRKKVGPAVRKKRHIAVFDDDGTLIAPASSFDLSNTCYQFRPKPRRITVRPTNYGFREPYGVRVPVGRDSAVGLDLPFTFPFFGESYDELFFDSTGQVFFEMTDVSPGLSGFFNGPPSIAGLYTDLDPTITDSEAGMYIAEFGNRVRFTWLRIPETGTTNESSFQITLFPNGKINICFGHVGAANGIFGLTPGGGNGTLELLDFSEDVPTKVRSRDVTIAEEFSSGVNYDLVAATSAFLGHFEDEYEHVLFFLDYPRPAGSAFASLLPVRNEIQGIGRDIFNESERFGSSAGGRLRAIADMGELSRYPGDPFEEFFGSDESGRNESTLDVIAHEVGHRWLTTVRFMDSNGNPSDDLVDFAGHWNFFMDSDGSHEQGNDIQDNGDGTFTTVGATERYSELDQYLMGLRSPSEVSPFFYVRDVSGTDRNRGSLPAIGVTFNGTRVDVGINDILAAEGPRTPSAARAPKDFGMAFVLIGREGQRVSAASIAKVARFRRQWIRFFNESTDELATVDTRLREK